MRRAMLMSGAVVLLGGLCGGLGGAAAAVAGADGQPNAGAARRATARLIADAGAIAPGETAEIAVTFQIQPGWHLYSPSQNDTGGPPTIEFTLPDGYTLGEPAWPAPTRHVLDYGDMKILDHVYEDELTVIFPLAVPPAPADAEPGSTASIAAKVNWIVCSDVCVFESQEVALELPVVAADEDAEAHEPNAEAAAAFERARARLPRPLPKENPPVTVRLADDAVTFTAPGAAYVAFYPADDGIPMANLADSGQVEGETLKIEFGSAESPDGSGEDVGAADAPPRLRGVLETRQRLDGPGTFWQIDQPSNRGTAFQGGTSGHR